MGFWLSSDRSHILLLTYGLIGDIGAAYCDWCPYYCACCPGLVPNFCGDGTDDGVGGGTGGPHISYVVTCSDPSGSTTGYLVNADDDTGDTGPCNWSNPLATFESDLYAFDSFFQDHANGCKWTMFVRFLPEGCSFDGAIVQDGDGPICEGDVTFTFSCGGFDFVFTFTIPAPSMMRMAEAAPSIPELPAPSPAIAEGMRAFVGAKPRRTTLLQENQRRAGLGLPPIKPRPCSGCGKKKGASRPTQAPTSTDA